MHPTTLKTIADYEKSVNLAKAKYEQIYRLAGEAANELDGLAKYITPAHFSFNMPTFENLTQEIDRKAWSKLMHASGLAETFDAVAMKQFEASLEHNPPVFSEATAKATILKLAGDIELMFNRGLVALFQRLSGKYKSHDAFKIKKKSIVKLKGWANSISHDKHNLVNDFDRVIKKLTGGHYEPYQLVSLLDKAIQKQEVYENEYFCVRFFDNGNGHIVIKNNDLINKINAIIAKYYGEQLGAK